MPTLGGHGLVNLSLRRLPAPTVGLFLLGEPLGASRTPVHCTTSGLLFGRMIGRLARPGQRIAKVAGAEPLANRGKLLAD